jgi:hypothetical protein
MEEEKSGEDLEDGWLAVKNVFNSVAEEVLGLRKQPQSRQWLSENSRNLANKRRSLKSNKRDSAENTREYNYAGRALKRSVKIDKETFLNNLRQRVEDAHAQNKTRTIYECVREITGRKTKGTNVIKDKNGTTLTESPAILQRWKEHFDNLYNIDNGTDNTVLNDIPLSSTACTEQEYTPHLTRCEVEAAMKHLKLGKSPGIDNVTADELQAGTG